MTEKERYTLRERIKDAKEEALERLAEEPNVDTYELAHEVADGSVPVYTYDLLIMAAEDDIYLATTEPELGPAFDGSPTPANVIAANVYERIYQEVVDTLQGEENK